MTEHVGEAIGVEVEYGKPVPVPDAASRPFFDGTLRGELVLQRCGACGQWMWPVRFRCISCLSDDLSWEASAGTGTIYSFTLVHQLVHPGFAGDLPYNVVMVDLDEGVRIISNLVDIANDEVQIGQRVAVTFELVSDEVSLPRFRLLELDEA